MNKTFISFSDAIQYAKQMRLQGYDVYVSEDNKTYKVLVWKVK